MNPRIYKKQAKRAVELLRSHGSGFDYSTCDEPGVEDPPYRAKRWLRLPKHVRSGWHRIKCIPYRWSSCDYGAYDCYDARNDWLMVNDWGGTMRFDEYGDRLPPLVKNHYALRQWISTKAIASGWCWRGGRALQLVPCRPRAAGLAFRQEK